MTRRIEARTLGAAFGAYFVIIGIASALHANGLTTPWFGPELSRWSYAAYLIGAAALLAGLAAAAVSRTQFLERRIIELNRRAEEAGPAPVEASAPTGDELPPPLVEEPPKDHVDRDIDDLLMSLSEMESTSAREAAAMEEEVPAEGPDRWAEPESPRTWTTREKLEGARKMRRSVTRYLAGPAAAAIFVLGISGAMLPGTETMLQSYHQLNTALILGIGYAWLGLGGYAVASVLALVRPK